jgi:hypothetical protein
VTKPNLFLSNSIDAIYCYKWYKSIKKDLSGTYKIYGIKSNERQLQKQSLYVDQCALLQDVAIKLKRWDMWDFYFWVSFDDVLVGQ